MLRTLRRAADRRRQADGDFGWLFNPYTGNELVAIDCETTGLDPRRAELVSIAAVTIRGERVITSESLDLRMQCPASLDGDSIRVHGLRSVDLEGGECVGDALARLMDFVGNRPLLGWCVEYDVAVINRQLRPRFGFDLPNALIDVSHRYAREMRRKHPELDPDRGFESMAHMLDVPVMGRHTALGDAVTTALMYLRLQRRVLRVG